MTKDSVAAVLERLSRLYPKNTTFFMFNISLLISVAKVQIICDFVRIFTENHYFCANILKA